MRSLPGFVLRFVAFLLLILSVSISCVAQVPGARFPRVVRYTVRPGGDTPIYLTVLPDAECTLRHRWDTDTDDEDAEDLGLLSAPVEPGSAAPPEHDLKLFSDASGIASFDASPTDRARDSEIILVLRCQNSAGQMRQRIFLRAAIRPTALAPFPPATNPQLNQPALEVVPPITGDPAAYSDDQLLQLGYPLRPDPTTNPRAYAQWSAAVSKPIKIIQAQTASNTGVQHVTYTKGSGNWSGFELIPYLPNANNDTMAPWVEIAGHWLVPQVIGEVLRTAHSSIWAGLDGDGQFLRQSAALVQAGTEQDALPGILTVNFWNITSYRAWTEVLDLQPVEQVITNFPVSPGDGIFCLVWVGSNGSDQPSTDTELANFYLYNSNTGLSTRVQTLMENFEHTINFEGTTAEWILERPGIVVNGQRTGFYDLARYPGQCLTSAANEFSSTYIDATYARAQLVPFQSQYATFDFLGRPNYNITLTTTNSPGLLSAAYSYPYAPDQSTMCFSWFGFR